jgi:hypothetical protein
VHFTAAAAAGYRLHVREAVNKGLSQVLGTSPEVAYNYSGLGEDLS